MPKALVIGGSVGGLLAANLLRSVGWDVVLFERARGDLSTRGAGIGASRELLDIMQRVGARFDGSAGITNTSYVWMARDGHIAFEHPRSNISSAWQRVYQPLRDVTPDAMYRQGMNLVHVEQSDDSVTAIFENGMRETADLLVASDGMLSTVRSLYLPDVAPRYANYVAWRGIAQERDIPAWARDAIAGRVVNCFPDGEQVLTMAVPGEDEDIRPGHRRFYIIWYRPANSEQLKDLCTDSSGRYHDQSIPPPLIRPEFRDELRQHAQEVLPPAATEVLLASPLYLLQAINDMEVPQMTFGRVAIMGDAAFVARPHSAAGVSKAALDAQCLADELQRCNNNVAEALETYNEKRMAFGKGLVAHARYLGAYLAGQAKPPEMRSEEERERDPRQIIVDYGAPHLLHDVQNVAS